MLFGIIFVSSPANAVSVAENGATVADVAAGIASIYDLYGENYVIPVGNNAVSDDSDKTYLMEYNTIPDAVGVETVLAKEHVARAYWKEGERLDKVVFMNRDYSYTDYYFGFPVKYIDDDGTIKDKTLEIVDPEINSTAYLSADGNVSAVFSKEAEDGISLTDLLRGVNVNLIPIMPEPGNYITETDMNVGMANRKDSKTIIYNYDAKTDIEYSLTYTGFKEDIVVKEYTGQTDYYFRLQTNGLKLVNIDDSYHLEDQDGNVKAFLGNIIIFTADERNNAMGTLNYMTVRENQEYLLNIHVDADYLSDPDTLYPIRIDPTIEINYDNNGANAIQDVTITSSESSSGSSGSMYIGKRASGNRSRILMKFPGIDIESYGLSSVTKVSVYLRDLMCESEQVALSTFAFEGNSWSEGNVSWDTVSPNSWGVLCDIDNISYSIGAANTPIHRYELEFTEAFNRWQRYLSDEDKGIIIKSHSNVENSTTTLFKTFATYNRSSYKPYVVINYNGS